MLYSTVLHCCANLLPCSFPAALLSCQPGLHTFVVSSQCGCTGQAANQPYCRSTEEQTALLPSWTVNTSIALTCDTWRTEPSTRRYLDMQVSKLVAWKHLERKVLQTCRYLRGSSPTHCWWMRHGCRRLERSQSMSKTRLKGGASLALCTDRVSIDCT